MDVNLRSDILCSCYVENEVKLRWIVIVGVWDSKIIAINECFTDTMANVRSGERSTSSSTESPVACR